MPLYEYECARCGRRFELIQKFSDPPTAACTCGGTANRLLSASTFQFKGSGWYATDYARKPTPGEKTEGAPVHGEPVQGEPAAAGKSDGNAKSDSKTEKKSEPAKPAAKASE